MPDGRQPATVSARWRYVVAAAADRPAVLRWTRHDLQIFFFVFFDRIHGAVRNEYGSTANGSKKSE